MTIRELRKRASKALPCDPIDILALLDDFEKCREALEAIKASIEELQRKRFTGEAPAHARDELGPLGICTEMLAALDEKWGKP